MSRAIRVSVILCTYNRARSLPRALESAAKQIVLPSVGWEVLVVDNNSTDNTRQVVEEFRRQHPERIRYVLEPKQGLSHARNAGIRCAKGEILAFIDDDERVDPEWLQNLTANLHSGEWAGAGGPVMPEWCSDRPQWLAPNGSFCLGPLAAFDPGLKAGQMTDPPVGANMAFRKEMFERFGMFRTDLGRVGNNLVSNEDIEFGRRLLAAGQRLRYEPSAVTYHPVTESRVRREYFLAWWFNKGRSDVREFGIRAAGQQVVPALIRVLRGVAAEAVRWVIAREPSERFVCRLKIWTYAGEVYEFFRQAFDAKSCTL